LVLLPLSVTLLEFMGNGQITMNTRPYVASKKKFPEFGRRHRGQLLHTLIHSWDLAKATGQGTRLDPELAHTPAHR